MITQFDQTFPKAPPRSGMWLDFQSDEDLTQCVYTQIASGTATVIDTNTTAQNGVLLFSSVDATENKGAQIQFDAEPINLVVNNKFRFLMRGALSEVTQSGLLGGFMITDTSIEASAPTDGVYFSKVDGSAVLNLIIRAADVTVATIPLVTLSGTGYKDYAFELLGTTSTSWIIRTSVWDYATNTLAHSVTNQVATVPTAEALTPSVAFQSGAAAIQTYALDGVGFTMDRL